MPRKFFSFFLLAAFLSIGFYSCCSTQKVAHVSKNSLDWAGEYKGVVPAADCSGIDVSIRIERDGTFELRYKYLDKSDDVFIEKGTFKWDNAGGIITLDIRDYPPHYKVGENVLIQLDMSGKVISGDLAGMYVLKKAQQ